MSRVGRIVPGDKIRIFSLVDHLRWRLGLFLDLTSLGGAVITAVARRLRADVADQLIAWLAQWRTPPAVQREEAADGREPRGSVAAEWSYQKSVVHVRLGVEVRA